MVEQDLSEHVIRPARQDLSMKQDLSMRQGLSGILMGILMDILIKQTYLAVKNSRSINLFHKPFHGGTGQRPVPSFRSLRICCDIAVIIHACYVMPFSACDRRGAEGPVDLRLAPTEEPARALRPRTRAIDGI